MILDVDAPSLNNNNNNKGKALDVHSKLPLSDFQTFLNLGSSQTH